MHDVECRRVFDRVFWFIWVSGFVFFSENVLGESVNSGQLLVSNNRAGTEERTKDVVEGYEGVVSDLGQDNATCLSGNV